MSAYSHSKLETYQNCPLKYKFQYVDRLQRKKQGIEAFLGSRVHEALEKLYSDLLHSKRNTKAEILHYFEEQWKKNYDAGIVKIVRKEYSPDYYKSTGQECIEQYYDRYIPFDNDTTLDVERRLGFSLDLENQYRITGLVDRLAKTTDGIWEIHDYKTSGHLPTQQDVDDDSQLGLYQIGVQQAWPDAERVRLVWHYLRFDTMLSSTRTQEQLDTLREKTIQLIDEIETAEILPPRESNLCDWCDFQDLCPKRKHLLTIASLPVEKFQANAGVQLVDEYADLKDQDRETKALLEEARKRLIAYARQEGLEVVSGTRQLASVLLKKKFKFPESGDEKRILLEEMLRQAGKWNEISSLSSLTLNKIIREGEWEPNLIQKVKEFAQEEEDSQVRLRKKQKEK
jgi:putative RecB family exonuclease